MSDALLLTKLYMPPSNPSVIPRQELGGRLLAGLQGRLTVITAPPGFGKTTLLSESLREMKRSASWLSIDAGDNDLGDFFRYVVAALKQVDDRIGSGVLALLRSPAVPAVNALVTALINEIVALEEDLVLVLDDFHLVGDPSVLRAVELLLERQPPRMHLVIASRADPSLPIARLRARGWITEIRTDDLRFTIQEATLYLNQIMTLGLEQDDIAALTARTEGWAAGLQLAALSLKCCDAGVDRSEFVRVFAGDDRHVMDYLVSEVLSRQSDDMNAFLVRTAVLERFCASLCDAVAYGGEPPGRSQENLEQLDRSNLFIVPLDNKRQWYRYHHLFADLLRHRLNRSQAVRIPDLHRRASEWHDQNGFVDQAIRHALIAGEHQVAAGFVESTAMNLVADGRLAKLEGWVRELPKEVVAGHPWLCTASAWASLLSGRVQEVEPLLGPVESILRADAGADSGRLRGHVLAIRAFMARWRGDAESSIRISQQALGCLPEEERVARGAVALNLGCAYMLSGNLIEAEPHFEEASRAGAESAYAALSAIQHLGDTQLLRGRLRAGVAIYRRALSLGTEWGGGQPLPATGYPVLGLGRVHYEWNDLERAAEYSSRGIELATQADDPFMEFEGRLARAWQRRALGAVDPYGELVDWATGLGGRVDRIWESSGLSAIQAESLLLRGDLTGIEQWVGERAHYLEGELSYTKGAEYKTLVRSLIALSRSDDALRLLSRLCEAADAGGRTGDLIGILALEAVAHAELNQGERAMAALQQALTLAEPEDYIRVFVDEGPIMARLLSEAGGGGVGLEYVGKLLAATTGHEETKARKDVQSAEGLSRRELEVLRLLGTEMSGPEMANELYVALSTIRTHTKRIYSKLNVSGRRAALSRAKELNLL